MELKTILIILVVILFVAISGWTFQDKSEKAVFKPLRLFPRWVKYLGLTWAILSLILSVMFILVFDFDILIDGKNLIGVLSANFGLLLICFSKDKIEDEMTNMIRLKSFYSTVFFGFSGILILDVLEILLGGSSLIPSFSMISLILSIYLVSFYITKSKLQSGKQA